MMISTTALSPNPFDSDIDDRVTKANMAQVLNSQAYMLFYCKTYLEYRPHATPSYVLAREHEARREEERQREKEAAQSKEVDEALLEIL
jgi:ubiquitin carboxyl-terminal hydrolase 22/27/51